MTVVFGVVDERLAVDRERREHGRSVVPRQVAPGVLDDEVGVLGQVALFHKLVERDLLFEERAVGRTLKKRKKKRARRRVQDVQCDCVYCKMSRR